MVFCGEVVVICWYVVVFCVVVFERRFYVTFLKFIFWVFPFWEFGRAGCR
jgi:hypothetical protein